ncbi:hypothetical protein BOX15_Mlig019790g1, partial [Macrostomum lignano]
KSSAGLRVIGAGLMRTGTNSQMKALEMLLGGRCYHMDIVMEEKLSHLQLWHRAAIQGLSKELAEEIFDDFLACTDFPAAHFYKELMQIYPDAKFVLSIRDPTDWVRSVRATILQSKLTVEYMLPPVRWLLGLSHYLPLSDAVLGSRLGFNFDMSDAEMIDAFNRHNDTVIRTIPKERLLVFRVSDGWEPLCKFLELPVPSNEPFPHLNDTKRFLETIVGLKIVGPLLNLAVCSAVFGGVWVGVKYLLRSSTCAQS